VPETGSRRILGGFYRSIDWLCGAHFVILQEGRVCVEFIAYLLEYKQLDTHKTGKASRECCVQRHRGSAAATLVSGGAGIPQIF
jgi:hypothetical protein